MINSIPIVWVIKFTQIQLFVLSFQTDDEVFNKDLCVDIRAGRVMFISHCNSQLYRLRNGMSFRRFQRANTMQMYQHT